MLVRIADAGVHAIGEAARRGNANMSDKDAATRHEVRCLVCGGPVVIYSHGGAYRQGQPRPCEKHGGEAFRKALLATLSVS